MKNEPPFGAKEILVTGASGVIGRAIVQHLARAGHRVHFAGRTKARLVSLQKDLASKGFVPPLYAVPLSNLAGCEKMVRDFFHNAKNPYGLVCVAGNLGR